MIWKCIFALITKNDWKMHHVDVVIAFFESDFKMKQWIQQSFDFEKKKSEFVCSLRKALYELKQFLREWYDCLKKYLISLNYICLSVNNCVFVHFIDIILSIYVDDFLLINFTINDIDKIKIDLNKRFRIKNFDEIHFYFEVKIIKNRINRVMWLTQRTFTKQFVKNCDFENCKSTSISMKSYSFKTNIHNDEMYQTSKNEKYFFRKIIEFDQWFTWITRSDIVATINKFSKYVCNSTSIHMHVVMHVVRYLSNISNLNLRFESKTNHNEKLMNYTNASYAKCENIFRFIFDYVFMFWNDFVFHFFKRQNIVVISTIEVEYIDQCNANKKIYFLIAVLDALKYFIDDFIDIRANNQVVIVLIHNFVNHQKIKHIAIKYHKIRKLMIEKIIKLIYISIKNMMIDDFIKSFISALFRRFVNMFELANEEINWIKTISKQRLYQMLLRINV